MSASEKLLAPPTRNPRRYLRYGVIFAVALSVGIAAFLYDPRSLFDADVEIAQATARDTAAVSVVDLANEYDADGTLLFGDTRTTAHVGPPGVLTDIVGPAESIEPGVVLWRVNNEPTIAIMGNVPSFRNLRVDDVGADVRQLEAGLVAMGYDPEDTVTVDETYTTNTSLMVERWQADIDAAVTGVVPSSSIVTITEPSRSGPVQATVGQSVGPGTPMLTLSSTTRVLEFTIPAGERDTLIVNDIVDGRLPDRSTFTAVIEETLILDSGAMTVTATTINQIGYLVDTVPVTVSWSVPAGADILVVPARALIRTDSGNYFVEVVDETEVPRMVQVDVGRQSGSNVEIHGAVADGDIVIAP